MRRLLGVTLVLMVLMGVSAQAQQAVVPGRSIGRISLGMARAEVWKHIGRPTTTGTFTVSGRACRWDDWRSPNNSLKMEVVSRRGRVVQIMQDPTDEEHRRNLFSSIRRQHPHLTVTLYDFQNEFGSVLVVDDARTGIAWELFLYHTDDFNMQLFNDVGPDRVIIHQAGRIALPNAGEKLNEHNPLMNDIRAWFAAKPTHTHKRN